MSRRSSGLSGWEERGDGSLSLNPCPSDKSTRPRQRLGTPGGRSPSGRDLSPCPLTLITAGLLLAAPPAAAQKPHQATSAEDCVVIQNTGSTNTSGYTFVLSRDGVAGMFGGQEDSRAVHLPKRQKPLVAKLFRDLAAAMPFKTLPARHGMRSASFGTKTYVTYKGQDSPDLTFGGDTKVNALRADVTAITQALHVGVTPRRPIVLHLNSTNKP